MINYPTVDAHRHMWQTQLRACMGDGTLVDYSAQIRNVFSACYDHSDVYLGILMGVFRGFECGCTTLIDHCHNLTILSIYLTSTASITNKYTPPGNPCTFIILI